MKSFRVKTLVSTNDIYQLQTWIDAEIESIENDGYEVKDVKYSSCVDQDCIYYSCLILYCIGYIADNLLYEDGN